MSSGARRAEERTSRTWLGLGFGSGSVVRVRVWIGVVLVRVGRYANKARARASRTAVPATESRRTKNAICVERPG
eukprot:scaffold60501_cov51-Phaeocystis_antarctica.AAC.1